MVYSPSGDRWYDSGASLTHQRWLSASADFYGKVTITGSHNEPSDSAEQYDPETNTCTQFPNLNVGRYDHAMVNLKGKLFVIGGKSKSQVLSSVEMFDRNRFKWKTVSPLKTAREGLAATEFNVCGYALTH